MKFPLAFAVALLSLCKLVPASPDLRPRLGAIEVYGTHKVSQKKILTVLRLNRGDALTQSPTAIEERINKINGVVSSRVEAACCVDRQLILYVGVEERGAAHIDFHLRPGGNALLPEEVVGHYDRFLEAVGASLRGHHADEDLTNGYSMMADPDAREQQQFFLEYTASHLSVLDATLRESPDDRHRAIAAYLLQYAPRGPHTTTTLVNALQYALQDTDQPVRENALEALRAVSVGGRLHPEQGIQIEPTWLVQLMNSIVWADRRDASLALVNLTDRGNPEALTLLRDRALPSVIEMARWTDLEHALPAFILAGRIAGLSKKQIDDAWVSGDREGVLKSAEESVPKHSTMDAILHRGQVN